MVALRIARARHWTAAHSVRCRSANGTIAYRSVEARLIEWVAISLAMSFTGWKKSGADCLRLPKFSLRYALANRLEASIIRSPPGLRTLENSASVGPTRR